MSQPWSFSRNALNPKAIVVGSEANMDRAYKFAEPMQRTGTETLVLGDTDSELPLGFDVIYMLAPNGDMTFNQQNLYGQVEKYMPRAEAENLKLGDGSYQDRLEKLRSRMVAVLFSDVDQIEAIK